MLQQIRELSKVYNVTHKYAAEFFINQGSKSKKALKMLKLIMEYDDELDDGLVKQEVYEHMVVSDKAYMMLRRHLREKLLNYLYLLKPDKAYNSEFMSTYFNAQKGLFLSRALFSLGLYKTGVDVAKRTLASAEKVELWDIIASISSILSDYYSARGDAHNFHAFDDKAQDALTKFSYERRIKRIVNEWNLVFLRKTQVGKSEIQMLEENLQKVNELCKQEPTAINIHLHYRLKLIYFQAKNDFQSAIRVCDEAIEFLEQKEHFNVSMRLGIYLWSKMFCYLNLRDFENARDFAEMGKKYFVKGTLNWFSVMEYYYVLSIQTQNYSTAYALVTEVITGDAYSGLPTARRQKWMLLEAYMEFIINSGIWEDMPEYVGTTKFKISRFINEVDVFKRDKTGIVVSILILQVLFMIYYSRYDQVIERRDALSRFIRRYMYTGDNERSRVFLTLLERVIDADFSYSICIEKTKRLIVALKSKEVSYVPNYGGNEILDYEILWEWLLNRLKENASSGNV